jgi:hypothetical protein
MNLPLLRALNQFADETGAFLKETDPDMDQWETFMTRREAILAELQGIECSANELAESTIVQWKAKIAEQEALVRERALAKLANLEEKRRTLEVGRRALQEYRRASSPGFFERNL